MGYARWLPRCWLSRQRRACEWSAWGARARQNGSQHTWAPKTAASCGRGRGQARQGERRKGCRLQTACIPHAQSLTVHAGLDAASLRLLSVGDLTFGLPNTPRPEQGGQCSLTLARTSLLLSAAQAVGNGTHWLADRPHMRTPHLPHARLPSPNTPPPTKAVDLTAAGAAMGRVMPEYQRTDVPSYPDGKAQPRGCTQLSCARSSLEMPSKHARVSKDGLPPPAPS